MGRASMQTTLRLEELAFFLFAIFLFSLLALPWWYFPLFLLLPDISMLGYLTGPRTGAILYNLVHHRGLALLIYVLGTLLSLPIIAFVGIILFAHSSLDRVFGYGLKFTDGFSNTHLGRIGHD
jgi:hypothetical protein